MTTVLLGRCEGSDYVHKDCSGGLFLLRTAAGHFHLLLLIVPAPAVVSTPITPAAPATASATVTAAAAAAATAATAQHYDPPMSPCSPCTKEIVRQQSLEAHQASNVGISH